MADAYLPFSSFAVEIASIHKTRSKRRFSPKCQSDMDTASDSLRHPDLQSAAALPPSALRR